LFFLEAAERPPLYRKNPGATMSFQRMATVAPPGAAGFQVALNK